ncbi:hypothetical protein CW304_17510 [Bacillus sp. UFRGS-B20]|nr:hypothetical protein CW304_17510 [Bacillus sp. UFRGS-B20]
MYPNLNVSFSHCVMHEMISPGTWSHNVDIMAGVQVFAVLVGTTLHTYTPCMGFWYISIEVFFIGKGACRQ